MVAFFFMMVMNLQVPQLQDISQWQNNCALSSEILRDALRSITIQSVSS
jgi:hypothetical protein